MKTFLKIAAAAALTGAIALAAVSPSEARNGRNAAAAVGFGAGALVGAAAAGAYNNGYYGEPGYAYDPGYAYAPDYAYVPAPAYAPRAYSNRDYYGYQRNNNIRNCTSSPASMSFGETC